MAPLKPASAKQKGRLLQQAVAAEILARYPELTKDDVRSTPMGVRGADVQLSARAKALFPYAVECKAVEKLNVWSAWEQCQHHVDADGGTSAPPLTPLLVCRRNRTPAFAVLPWTHVMELLAPGVAPAPASAAAMGVDGAAEGGEAVDARDALRSALACAMRAAERL